MRAKARVITCARLRIWFFFSNFLWYFHIWIVIVRRRNSANSKNEIKVSFNWLDDINYNIAELTALLFHKFSISLLLFFPLFTYVFCVAQFTCLADDTSPFHKSYKMWFSYCIRSSGELYVIFEVRKNDLDVISLANTIDGISFPT